MIPLYGFLQGDTIGLLMLAGAETTVDELAKMLAAAASVRVPPGRPGVRRVIFRGRVLDGASTLAAAGLEALDRFDVVTEDA